MIRSFCTWSSIGILSKNKKYSRVIFLPRYEGLFREQFFWNDPEGIKNDVNSDGRIGKIIPVLFFLMVELP